MALALLGVLAGFGLRLLVHDLPRRAERRETRQERFTLLVALLSQSAAIGLALTFLADALLAGRGIEVRLLAGLTLLIAAVTSFAAAFLREVIRRLFYR